MATKKITTSIVVDFAASSSNILKAEIDDREDGYNNGVTSFVPGDSPAFLIFKSTGVSITAIAASAGSIQRIGSGVKEVTEIHNLAMEREVSTGYPVLDGFSSKWLGNNGGLVSVMETKIAVPSPIIAVLKTSYNAEFTAYRLYNVPLTMEGETSFPVVIYIAGSYRE